MTEAWNNSINDQENNMIFWHVFFDDDDMTRLYAIMKNAKNILAKHGNVCIQLKPQNKDCFDIMLFEDNNNDEYLNYLSSLLKDGTDYVLENIKADKTMKSVTPIEIESYDAKLGWKYKLHLYLS